MNSTAKSDPCLRDNLSIPLDCLKKHSLPYTENNISYDILYEKDILRAAACLTEAYFSDPKTQLCAQTELIGYQQYFKKYNPMFLDICKAAVEKESPPSFIAKTLSEEVVGVLLTGECHSDDLEAAHPLCSAAAPPEYEPVIDMVKQLDLQISQQYPEIKTHKTLHLCNEGVLPEYRHREVGLNLGLLCMEHAISGGYDYVIAETSTRATQYILQKYVRFSVVAELNYKTYSFKGQHPFAHLADLPSELSCQSYLAMVKQIDRRKN
ncbi:hypothetical protein DI392_06520 [Vibrio albus]|uniref:N-acetyltransferase domain-containing protein n=1 Tax=Vibrio albus TaxID=2200953 RepID=A0A2U3BAN2_9VIBR|nr:hypothetical protein [Vibrio albus]PWI33850.1 hypothetical protein DI392_06520 [Vibrio albus]